MINHVNRVLGAVIAAIVITVTASNVHAGRAPVPKVDLTYKQLLSVNGVDRSAWLSTWLRTHKAPSIARALRGWDGGPIRTMILFDHPAFHAAERMVSIFVASDSIAHGWVIVDGELQEYSSGSIPIALFRSFFATVSSWEQGPPLPPDRVPTTDAAGYFGFLTIVQADRTRQILLNLEDFFLAKDPTFSEANAGRVTQAFRPIMEAIEGAH